MGGRRRNPSVEWGLACFALLILATNCKRPCRINQYKISVGANSERPLFWI